MECFLGRELTSKEIVHHVNGDRRDNRIKNLEIVTRAQHMKMHEKGRPKGNQYDKKFYISPKEILKLYPDKTQQEIAEIYGCSSGTIQRLVDKHGIRNKIKCTVCGAIADYRKHRLCKKHYLNQYYRENKEKYNRGRNVKKTNE
jgi:hypothetical protein